MKSILMPAVCILVVTSASIVSMAAVCGFILWVVLLTRGVLVLDHLFDRVVRWRLRLPSLARLVREEAGQDILEYALLGAFIGTVGILAWQNIGSGIYNAYTGWDTGIQSLSSCTPDPGGGGC